MRIVRFSPPASAGIGSDPLFGVLNDRGEILVVKGDPIYAGIVPTETMVALEDVRLLAPVIPRSKVVCVGKNYADHAAEMNSAVPDEPIIFLKPNTSVIGPEELIQWPAMAPSIDYEGELAIVISRICKDVPKEKSRELQKRDGQWMRAKSFDTFCPLGPWIETEFIPGSQRIETIVDGVLKQSEPISSMIFDIPTIINFVSSVMTLLPGDVILTGTPSGIGPMGAGDKVQISIEGIGQLTNTVSAHAR